jgi:hypothetical protein
MAKKEKKEYDYLIYAKVEDGIIKGFQGRKNSSPKEGEVEFTPDWGGTTGDRIEDFKNGIKIQKPKEDI